MNNIISLLVGIMGGKGVSSAPAPPPPPPPAGAPTNFVTQNKYMRFAWDNVAGATSANLYEYRLKGGSILTCTGNPQNIPADDYATGEVEVRLKANGSQPAASWLSNSIAFTTSGRVNSGKGIVDMIGDSLANQWGTGVLTYIDTNDWQQGPNGWGVSSYSGAVTATIQSVLKQNLAIYGYPNSSHQVVAINAGTNDWNAAGNSPGVGMGVWAGYVTMCNLAHSMGWKVVLVIPGDTGTTGGVTSNHAQHGVFVAYARAHWQEIADDVADLAADPNIGMMYAGSAYSPDGTHYTTAGYLIAGQIILAAMNRVLARVSVLADQPTSPSITGNSIDWTNPAQTSAADIEYSPNGYDWSAVTSKPFTYPYRREANCHFLRTRPINGNAPSLPVALPAKTGVDMASEGVPFYDARWNVSGFVYYIPHMWYSASPTAYAALHFTEGILFNDTAQGGAYTVEIDGVPYGGTYGGGVPFEYHDAVNPTQIKEFRVIPTGAGYVGVTGATIFG